MARGIAHREWAIHRSDYDTDQEFREAVEAEMVLNVQIMERLGVAIIAAPARDPHAEWMTKGVVFRTATVPAGDFESDETDLAGLAEDVPDLAGVGPSE